MADEYLTVLLRMEGKMDGLLGGLAQVDKAQRKVGDSANDTAKKQEKWLGGTRKKLQDVRAAFGEYTGTLNLAKQAFGFLGDAADSFASKNTAAGKSWKEATKEWDKATTEFKQAIGGIVVSLGPLIGALSKIVGLVADVVSTVGGPAGGGATAWLTEQMAKAKAGQRTYSSSGTIGGDWLQAQYDKEMGRGDILPFSSGTIEGFNLIEEQFARVAKYREAMKNASLIVEREFKGKRGKGKPSSGGGYSTEYTDLGPLDYDYARRFGNTGTYTLSGGPPRISDSMLAGAQGAAGIRQTNAEGGDWSKLFASLDIVAADQGGKTQGPTVLERMFGSVDQIDGYSVAFQGLADASSAAFDAWVSGEMSIGEAIKASLKATLSALGKRMMIRGFEELAEGTAALFVNPAAAGGHFAAAGMFEAGAALAGYGAKKLGKGGGGGGAGSNGGANLGGGNVGVSSGSNITVIVGDYFGSSPREKQGRVAREIRAARKAVNDENADGVRFS